MNVYSRLVFALFCLFSLLLTYSVSAQSLRSFDELFPGLSESRRNEVFRDDGFIRSTGRYGSFELFPASGSGIDLHNAVMKSNPSFLAESLLVVPYSGIVLNRLDAYNALGKISGLKGRLYNSYTRNAEVPLFEDAARLESERRNNPVPDPPPATVLPASETVYIRLRDTNFGNSYYRADLSVSPYGVTYNLTNYRTITYTIFTVIEEGKFNAILYIEPLVEGMLVYSVAGTDTSNFIANRIDIPSAIEKRLAVFIGWVSDGLKTVR